jgi:hypothetical protein
MLCAEIGRDRESPVTLKGAEISKETFLSFKIFLPFLLPVGLNWCETLSLKGRLPFG